MQSYLQEGFNQAPHWSHVLKFYSSLSFWRNSKMRLLFSTKRLEAAVDALTKSCSANFESTCVRISFKQFCRPTTCNFLKRRLGHMCVEGILWHFLKELFWSEMSIRCLRKRKCIDFVVKKMIVIKKNIWKTYKHYVPLKVESAISSFGQTIKNFEWSFRLRIHSFFSVNFILLFVFL